MSVALWPAFEDGHGHALVDEGTVLLDAVDELDALAESACVRPLSSFDAYAEVPEAVIVELAEAAEGIPDLSGFPATWHDPAEAVATLDLLIAGTASTSDIHESLDAFREVLRAAADRGTRFHLTIN